MSEFTTHDLDSAPQASRALLQGAKEKFGFVPNLLGVMAESPVTLESYLNLAASFDKTALTVTERQLVILSISRLRNCTYCLAAHGTISKLQKIPAEIVEAVYYKQPLEDASLEALRTFTSEVLAGEGFVEQDVLQAFYEAGYHKQHVLEVILGISFKTISNYINHINNTPIDTNFLSGIPDNTFEAVA